MKWNVSTRPLGETLTVKRFAWIPVRLDGTNTVVWLESYWCELEWGTNAYDGSRGWFVNRAWQEKPNRE